MKPTISILAIAAAFGLMTTVEVNGQSVQTSPDEAIRPFHINVSAAQLKDLKQRIMAARWPDRETVQDYSQGVKLDRLQALAQYWGTTYDWRKAEAKLNALPQFTTNIDGVEIYFIHVRSKEKNAMPLIITHGWPGSVFEMLKTISPLTDPVAYGGKPEDAFDVVIPALPGYGFSGRVNGTGWDPDRIARAWATLMTRLGYSRYVAQGGDWGSAVCNSMGRLAPAGLLAIHINLPAALPPDVEANLGKGAPAPPEYSEQEKMTYEALAAYRKSGASSYFVMLSARPQGVGYGLDDSPVGLAGFLLLHPGFSAWTYGDDPLQLPTKDDVLDDFSLYWLTKSGTSAGRLYWENKGKSVISAAAEKTQEIKIPVAITVFPQDVYRAPETWARRCYPNLIYFHEVDKGGHFAAWEQPQLFTEEMRAAFRSIR